MATWLDGTFGSLALPTAFLLMYLTVPFWRVAGWVAALYGGASVVCTLVYAIDKSAAVAGRWRVSENTLHTLGLVGGWPGALVANVKGFVTIHSPLWLRVGGFDSRCGGGGCPCLRARTGLPA